MTQEATKTLREWRQEKGLTQEQLVTATRNRVGQSTIGRIERGEVKPERKTKEDLADALGLRMEDIRWP